MRDWGISVINQLNGPTSLVLDPHEDNSGTVAGRELLIRLVPFDQDHVAAVAAEVVVGAHGKLLAVLLAVGRGEGDAHDAAHISGGQPTLLVVVVPIQFPSLVLSEGRERERELEGELY